MIDRRVFSPMWIVSLMTICGFMAALCAATPSWAMAAGQSGSSAGVQTQRGDRPQSLTTPPRATAPSTPSPQTIDEYAALVQQRLQEAARTARQRGTAELNLTIDKTGSIRQTDVVAVDGPSALNQEIKPLVSRIAPLPPLPAGVDVLTIKTDLAFDYPGENLYDTFGQLSRYPG